MFTTGMYNLCKIMVTTVIHNMKETFNRILLDLFTRFSRFLFLRNFWSLQSVTTPYMTMQWQRFVGSLKIQVSFAKEPTQTGALLQTRPNILRSLQKIATPQSRAGGRVGGRWRGGGLRDTHTYKKAERRREGQRGRERERAKEKEREREREGGRPGWAEVSFAKYSSLLQKRSLYV